MMAQTILSLDPVVMMETVKVVLFGKGAR